MIAICDPEQNTLTWPAPAKLNLTLEVVAKRSDGYHAIETLMIPVDLQDELAFSRMDAELVLTCSDPAIPTDGRNLVLKAAVALQRRTGCRSGARIHLTKRIPHEAGLGGGSSDAATTILALDKLWNLGLSSEELASIAAEVGSDVAFFLARSAAWCTGRGELVEPVPCGAVFDLVIVKPPIGLSTQEIYRRVVVPENPRSGWPAREALQNGDRVALGRALWNRLQAPAFAVAPVVESLYRELTALGPLGCQLSGSGSALFALCRDALEANRIADAIRTSHVHDPLTPQVFVCRSRPAPSPHKDQSR